MAKLTPNTKMILDYVREHDEGDGVKLTDIAEALGLTKMQVVPVVSITLKEKKDGSRPSLVTYEKRVVEGEPKPVGYVHITEAGMNYEDPEEDVAE